MGHSKGQPISTTYGHPILARQETFKSDYIEAWCTKRVDAEDDGDDANKKSAMVANPDAVAFLEMANRPIHGDYENE